MFGALDINFINNIRKIPILNETIQKFYYFYSCKYLSDIMHENYMQEKKEIKIIVVTNYKLVSRAIVVIAHYYIYIFIVDCVHVFNVQVFNIRAKLLLFCFFCNFHNVKTSLTTQIALKSRTKTIF